MRPYKVGAAALYAASDMPCVPAACNVGLFWPRRGVMRRPGRAVVEFLPAIEPGLSPAAFLTRLEAEVEGATDRLLAKAGHRPGPGAAPLAPDRAFPHIEGATRRADAPDATGGRG